MVKKLRRKNYSYRQLPWPHIFFKRRLLVGGIVISLIGIISFFTYHFKHTSKLAPSITNSLTEQTGQQAPAIEFAFYSALPDMKIKPTETNTWTVVTDSKELESDLAKHIIHKPKPSIKDSS